MQHTIEVAPGPQPVSFVLFLLLGIFLVAQDGTCAEGPLSDEIRSCRRKGLARSSRGTCTGGVRTRSHSVLWGYNSPPQPLYLAGVYAYLYKTTGENAYAERAVTLLSAYGDLRETLPPGFEATRAEYEQGVPAVSNFFYLPPYVRAVRELQGSPAFSGAGTRQDRTGTWRRVLISSSGSRNGGHTTVPRCAPRPCRCGRGAARSSDMRPLAAMAAAIGADNVRHWEIEDATVYHPVWLHAVLTYADLAHRPAVARSPMMRYYMEYFIAAHRTVRTDPGFRRCVLALVARRIAHGRDLRTHGAPRSVTRVRNGRTASAGNSERISPIR